MALKVELKPGEKLLVGDCIITNSDQRTRLFISGNAPILREKDILTSETANTPAKRIYLAVQLMYIDERITRNRVPADGEDDAVPLMDDAAQADVGATTIVDKQNVEAIVAQDKQVNEQL